MNLICYCSIRTPKPIDTTTYKLSTESLSAFDNKLLVGEIFYAPEKAFNCANHNTRGATI